MKRYIYILVFMLGAILVQGQDVHFSQFFNMPLLTNPALTGNSQYLIRTGLNYRNQWASFTTPFVTQSAFVDYKILPAKLKGDWIGAGGVFYNDQAGDGTLKTTKGMLLASYTKGFDREKNFFGGVGFSLGFANRSLDYSKLYFESQWIGYTFDEQKESNEHNTANSFFYWDMNAGLFLKYNKERKFEFHLGASFNHVNRPYEKFYDTEQRMGFKTNIHAGMTLVLDNIYIKPDFLYSYVNGSDELIIGTMVSYCMDQNFIYIGCFTRSGRDVIPMGGVMIAGIRLMASYDYNISKLKFATMNKGGIEITITGSFKVVGDMRGTKFRESGGIPKFSGY